MLKALSPITTLIIAWCAAFAEPSASKLVNVVIIALGVLLSSLGEVRFAWTGFIFQMIGTVAESARLVLIQWLLTANQADTQQQPQRATAADEDSCLASSSSSSSNSSISDHEFDAGDVGVASGHSDGDDWSNLPTQGRGAAQISRDDEGNIAVMSPLALLYYYSPVCALLNGLTALMFEAPDFDWNDLNRVGVGMLALNGGVAFLLNLTSVLLVSMPFPCLPATPWLLSFSMWANKYGPEDRQDLGSDDEPCRHPEITPARGCVRLHLGHSDHASPRYWLCYFPGGHVLLCTA